MEGIVAFFLYGAAAVSSGLSAVAIVKRGFGRRSDGLVTVTALAAMTVWSALIAALGVGHALVQGAEILRNIAWIFVVFRLFANDGRDESIVSVRPVVAALIFVEILQALLVAGGLGEDRAGFTFTTAAILHVLVTVGALFLLHNLFAGAAASSRRVLTWICAALALFWGYELNFYTVAYLSGVVSTELSVLRGAVAFAIGPLAAIGLLRSDAGLAFRPSRAVTLSSLSLGIMGLYFAAMMGLSEWMGHFSGEMGRIVQVGFVLAAAGFALLWIPSGRLRRWLRVTVLKHLFKHRYDYRSEWKRFTDTIGRAADGERSLHERAIQSLADITDCPAGLLLLPGDDGDFVVAANWKWANADVPFVAVPRDLAREIRRSGQVMDFDEVRRSGGADGLGARAPSWMAGEDRAWAGIPLLHNHCLVGIVILARPHVRRGLDWEDFDLLAIAGQQVASYLAEQAGQHALEEAAKFDEFNRRMAFVMHDIKNLSSQLSLLLRNAERHADNPDFRKDMLVTLRNSSDKLNALLSRLGRYGATRGESSKPFDLVAAAREQARRFSGQHEITVSETGPCTVVGDREAFEQALGHIVQNAVDASPPQSAVLLEIRGDGVRGEIAVIDTGSGMSAHFVHNELFRPFVSSKDGGFGIGACEAREMIRTMGGRLNVESREGLGTRFTISLPSSEAARLIAGRGPQEMTDDSEAA